MSRNTLIVIVGPTAVGKTALSIALAKELACEIVSCDSRQFFKEMSIGTAKPTPEEMDGVKHHFIDSHSIHDFYTVGDFERESLQVLDSLFKKNRLAIMVGGSGLYVKAVCEGFDTFPEIDKTIRESLNKQLKENGLEALQEELKQRDPVYYQKVDIHNSQRVIRALEVCIGSGKPYSSFTLKQANKRPFDIIKIGIHQERESLNQRINLRVDLMVKAGLLKEAEALYPFKHMNALQTVGYQEIFDFMDGKHSYEEAIELIKQNSRRYAKKQMTWFTRDESINWFKATEYKEIKDFLRATLN